MQTNLGKSASQVKEDVKETRQNLPDTVQLLMTAASAHLQEYLQVAVLLAGLHYTLQTHLQPQHEKLIADAGLDVAALLAMKLQAELLAALAAAL